MQSNYSNQLEPAGLLRHFLNHPPEGFHAFMSDEVPGFFASFDLLSTADAPLQNVVTRIPGSTLVRRLLRWRTCFFGSTVSEYIPLLGHASADTLIGSMLKAWNRRSMLMIVKDIPEQSPLLPSQDTARATDFLAACKCLGFIIVEGQALAYVPIDFASEEEYLGRLSYVRRKNIRRKLRVRSRLRIETLSTGDARLSDPALLDELYALYLEVYEQSEIHFDRLSAAFFRAVFQDSSLDGQLFLYYSNDDLIGYNLCFIYANMLIDKYVGFRYPAAREHNLYFVSWMENLTFARARGLTNYVAGWTDPEIKSYLGARFTFTRHAVFVRNRFLRFVLRRMSKYFESDRTWFDGHANDSSHETTTGS
ncbi:MAG TPA: GNAT family N-acetyltransferase [Rhodocyclaceae bacterium]|nr:GNAT family N-acetyltransferase [Rhodocyclaceae bacterium]